METKRKQATVSLDLFLKACDQYALAFEKACKARNRKHSDSENSSSSSSNSADSDSDNSGNHEHNHGTGTESEKHADVTGGTGGDTGGVTDNERATNTDRKRQGEKDTADELECHKRHRQDTTSCVRLLLNIYDIRIRV